jgi:hypothetical protein
MAAKSKAQQQLMGAAEHGANFPMAKKLCSSMTHSQMHDFAATSTKNLPAHVKTPQKRGRKLGGFNYAAKSKSAMHGRMKVT